MGISFYNINMYEIELKAHVPNRKVVIEKINSFATFLGTTIKDDTYFHFQYNDSDKHLTCRIRHEVYTFPDGKTKIQDVLTYKTKKKKTDKNGSAYEVNEENESILSDSASVIKLLVDTGYTKSYSKHKDVMQWITSTEYGQAHLELCNIPQLGDFLEIEIVTETCTNEDGIRDRLKSLIEQSGIPLSNIEERYYSELLKLAKGE